MRPARSTRAPHAPPAARALSDRRRALAAPATGPLASAPPSPAPVRVPRHPSYTQLHAHGWGGHLHTRICLCPKCRLHGGHIQPDRRLLLRSVPARPPPHPPDAPRPGPRGPLTLAHPSALHASAILAACGINTYSSGLAAACVACPSASTSGASASSCTCNGGYSTAGIASTLACTGTGLGRSRGRMRTE